MDYFYKSPVKSESVVFPKRINAKRHQIHMDKLCIPNVQIAIRTHTNSQPRFTSAKIQNADT